MGSMKVEMLLELTEIKGIRDRLICIRQDSLENLK